MIFFLPMKTLVLCVDRDNDFGRKANCNSPIIGREDNLRAAQALALADPEDSDSNCLYAAISTYDKLEDAADIREHCYRIMTVIENTTADSIAAEERHIEAYEKQQKWLAEKEERKRLLTPKYDGSQLKTIYSHFIYSFANCEWVCQKCGEKFHKSGEYNTLKKRIMEHDCKGVKLKMYQGNSTDPNNYMDSI